MPGYAVGYTLQVKQPLSGSDTTLMRLRVCFACLALVTVAAVALGQETELELQAGAFRYISDSELGKPILFENEIDSTQCFPLMISGRVIGWLSRAYSFDRRLLVKRCVEFDPSEVQTTGSRHGGENESWEEARLEQDEHLITARLRFPHETFFSNGSFCSGLFAYWGYSNDDELIPVIYDLTSRSITASRSLGKVNFETDDRGFLAPPKWRAACSEAVFDATVAKRPVVTLLSKRTSR